MIEWFVGLPLVVQLLTALFGLSVIYALIVLLYLLVLSYVVSGPIDLVGGLPSGRRAKKGRYGRS